jgi:hypothetical protein
VSGWVVPANQGIGVQLPPGFQVAGMGRRVGAWILDRLLSGFLAIIPVVLAIVTGAVSLNQQALDQLRQADPEAFRPFSSVTAPLFNVNTGPLILAVVVYVALNVAYYAGCWVKFGGTPCQRGLKLRVANVTTGENLGIGSALIRWAVLEGIAVCVSAIFIVLLFDSLAKTPTNQWLGYGTYGSAFGTGAFGGVTLMSNLVSWGSSLWLIILIVSAGTHSAHRGLHDRLVGSIVVGPAQLSSWPAYQYPPQGWPGYPYPPSGPGYPPQGQGYQPQAWPGYPYPPSGPGYPPQGQGYPPQGQGYPPPGQGYPPQAWPGYPPQAWPGYPPQGPPSGQPATPPPSQPASGDPPTGAPGQ